MVSGLSEPLKLVSYSWFFYDPCRILWKTLDWMYRHGIPTDDAVAIKDSLKRQQAWDAVGTSFLGQCLAGGQTVHWRYYASLVREMHWRREAMKEATDIVLAIADLGTGTKVVGDMEARLRVALSRVAEARETANGRTDSVVTG